MALQYLPRPRFVLDSSSTSRFPLGRCCCQPRPHRRRPLTQPLLATNTQQGNSSSQSNPPQNPTDSSPAPQNSTDQRWQQAEWDLDFYHYGPKWLRPPILIVAGISFIAGCNVAAKEGLETTAIAAAPVAVAWFLAFYVVPKQFRAFAHKYLRTHPEALDKALQEALQEQQQKLQQQQQQERGKPLQGALEGQSLQQQEQSKQQ
mmetsp:Transcript_13634/g.36868  ORF Transcript_13634/g.36868 Transcript_13634/m.36868 type:complete len:204 (+) Transcript_13634:46-657(+)